MDIKAGEKIGIVGRTGAGSELRLSLLSSRPSNADFELSSAHAESSIMSALFRLVE